MADGEHHLASAPARQRNKATRRPSRRLFHWNDLPEYLRDNEYIVTGYRADTGLWGSLRSLFRLHNESGNIWTHLCGASSAA
jgi:adiponectin receptor